MNSKLRFVGVLVALFALPACGGDDDDLTVGTVCTDIGNAFCDRLISCGEATAADRTECRNLFLDGCCREDNSCGEKPPAGTETAIKQQLNMCVSAIKTFDCARVSAGDIPPACDADASSAPLSSAAVSTPAVRKPDLSGLNEGRRVGAALKSLSTR